MYILRNLKPGVGITPKQFEKYRADQHFQVTDPAKRANFVSHVTNFIKEHNFDGLDLG